MSLAATTGGLFFLADEGQNEGAAVRRAAVPEQEDAQDPRHAVEPHARTVTADGYLKSMGARLPRIPPQLSASA
ncbi:MAG TPA: hypothetical protein VJ349_16690 [Stellaceae bacterium]|nr:hypothetical protein [Stellaceae bacterium]